MGDRCRLEVTLKRSDLPRFYEATSTEENYWCVNDNRKTVTVQLQMDEANYALSSELEQAAQKGIAFHGWHDAGSDYPEEAFVTCDNSVLYCQYSQGDPVARLYMREGRYIIDAEQIAAINAFRAAEVDVQSDFEALERGAIVAAKNKKRRIV